jgi:hypothetical protein
MGFKHSGRGGIPGWCTSVITTKRNVGLEEKGGSAGEMRALQVIPHHSGFSAGPRRNLRSTPCRFLIKVYFFRSKRQTMNITLPVTICDRVSAAFEIANCNLKAFNWKSQFVTTNVITPQSSPRTNPMRRFVTGGSAFISLTSRANRSMSSTSTSITEAVRSWPRSWSRGRVHHTDAN